jgi:hypothetical protein
MSNGTAVPPTQTPAPVVAPTEVAKVETEAVAVAKHKVFYVVLGLAVVGFIAVAYVIIKYF